MEPEVPNDAEVFDGKLIEQNYGFMIKGLNKLNIRSDAEVFDRESFETTIGRSLPDSALILNTVLGIVVGFYAMHVALKLITGCIQVFTLNFCISMIANLFSLQHKSRKIIPAISFNMCLTIFPFILMFVFSPFFAIAVVLEIYVLAVLYSLYLKLKAEERKFPTINGLSYPPLSPDFV